MPRPDAVKLVSTCPTCKEAVELILTRREVEELAKAFKLPVHQANLVLEARLQALADRGS